MADKKIQVPKKEILKGEDGYKVFSVRIKTKTVDALDEIVAESKQTRNSLINLFLEYGVENYEIVK